jgi:AraC-like DNA-binding protein
MSDFGLRLAERRSLSNLGTVALIVREQPTIRKVFETLVDYIHLHSEALRLKLENHDDLAILTLSIDTERPVPIRQGVEMGIGFLHRSLQQLLGPSWKPCSICFVHNPPSCKDAHRRFFGTRVEFNQDFNGIMCDARDLDTAVTTSDATMVKHIQKYFDTLERHPNSSMRATVRDCISVMLPTGLCSSEHLAKRLGVDRRTVHRHLVDEGETFTSLLDSVRVELATRYITNRERPLSSVAELLGFSAPSAFSRWFRDRFGCTVSQWRAEHALASPRTKLALRIKPSAHGRKQQY